MALMLNINLQESLSFALRHVLQEFNIIPGTMCSIGFSVSKVCRVSGNYFSALATIGVIFDRNEVL